jgi:hypothetical protein
MSQRHARTGVLLLLSCLVSAAIQAQQAPESQQVRDGVRDGRKVRVVSVPIDDTGITDATLRNEANPPDLYSLGGGLPVELEFRNNSTQDLTVRIGSSVRLFLPRGDTRSITVDFPNGQPAVGTVRFDVGAEGLTLTSGTGYLRSFLLPPSAAALRTERQAYAAQSRDPGAMVRTLSMPSVTPGPPPPVGSPAPPDPSQFVIRIRLNGTGIDDWDFRNLRNPPYLLKTSPANSSLVERLGAELSQEKLRSTTANVNRAAQEIEDAYTAAKDRYKHDVDHPRPGVELVPPENPWNKLALLDHTVVELSNYSLERTFSVVFDIPEPLQMRRAGDAAARTNAKEDFEKATGMKLGDCGGTPVSCKLVLLLPFQAPKTVRPTLFIPRDPPDEELAFYSWYKYLSVSQLPISFSVNFFDENATPAESTGYMSLVPLSALKEPSSKTAWILSPTISASRDPLVTDTSSFSPDAPFQGDVRRVMSGTARLQLKQTLGARADATVDFGFKSGVLGEKDQTGKVSVPTYQVNVNSIPGLRLSFGRFLFASPAQGIAVKEQGEGFRIGFRNRVGIGTFVRRESLDGTPDTGNRDNKVVLLEVNNVAGRRWNSIRGFNFLVSAGQDRAPKTEHMYATAGFDTAFSIEDSPFAGTFAYYHSRRWKPGGETDPPLFAGRGNVALLTLGYTVFEKVTPETIVKRKPLASLRWEWGFGSGDDLRTDKRDEGFLGETSSFSPDTIFLSTFAAKLKDVGPGITGLRKKHYLGLVYQEERFTPLDIVAKALKIPPSDVASRLLRAGARVYYFTSSIAAGNPERPGGYELFCESQIETPAGVRSILQLAHYRPGQAVRPYFKNRGLWSLVAKVTVALGS